MGGEHPTIIISPELNAENSVGQSLLSRDFRSYSQNEPTTTRISYFLLRGKRRYRKQRSHFVSADASANGWNLTLLIHRVVADDPPDRAGKLLFGEIDAVGTDARAEAGAQKRKRIPPPFFGQCRDR